MIVYGIRISYLSSKKLFGGGDDDDDRGSSSSSSSSSSYSEPVRYEAPKQSYSAPQQKVYYEESKPTYSGGGGGRSYSYVEESPRTPSGGSRPYSSFEDDIFGDDDKKNLRKRNTIINEMTMNLQTGFSQIYSVNIRSSGKARNSTMPQEWL